MKGRRVEFTFQKRRLHCVFVEVTPAVFFLVRRDMTSLMWSSLLDEGKERRKKELHGWV